MSVDKVVRELEKLKDSIADCKETLALYKGRKQELESRLEKEFEVKSLDEAEKKLKSLRERITKLEKEIEREFEDLKERYEW